MQNDDVDTGYGFIILKEARTQEKSAKSTSDATIRDDIDGCRSIVATYKSQHREHWFIGRGNWVGDCHGTTGKKDQSCVHEENQSKF